MATADGEAYYALLSPIYARDLDKNDPGRVSRAISQQYAFDRERYPSGNEVVFFGKISELSTSTSLPLRAKEGVVFALALRSQQLQQLTDGSIALGKH